MLWWALFVAFAVRASLVAAYPILTIWNDESLHYVTSLIAANVDQPILGHWPPLYDAMLATIFRVFGPDLAAVRWVQVVISSATVGFVYGIARELAGRRAARIAAFLCAGYPSLVAFSHYIYSETLFSALLVAGFYLVVRAGDRRRTRQLALAGVLFGLAALTRSVAVYFLPCWLLWLAVQGRFSAVRRAAVVLVLALL